LTCGCGGFFGDAKTSFDSTVFLANLYYDFNRGGRFVPYIGAGIGFAHTRVDDGIVTNGCGCVATFDGASETNFALAAMAGFSWKIRGGEPVYVGGLKDNIPVQVSGGRAMYLDVGYRYLWLGDVKTGDLVFTGVNPPPPVDPEIKNLSAHEVRVGLRYDLN
jgi:opacity protein-like surface antigen